MDIDARISRLLSRIAKMNSLTEASGKQVGDLLGVGNDMHRIVLISGGSRVGEDSYFLVEQDLDELSEICVDLSRTNPLIVAPEDAKRYLSGLIWEVKKNEWSKRGTQPEINRIIERTRTYQGEKAVVRVPVWGLNLGSQALTIGPVEFKPRPFPGNIEEEIKSIGATSVGIDAVAITLSSGDQGTIFENAKVKINAAINAIRAFTFPLGRNDILQEICIYGDYRPLLNFYP